MLMKYFFIFLCLFLSAGELFAQNPPARVSKRWLEGQDSTTRREVLEKGDYAIGAEMDRGFGLHLMPFSFINVLPRLRLGAQFKSNRFSYQLDVEYGVNTATELSNDLGNRDYRFWGLRPEIRYDVSAYNRDLYLGLELPVSFVKRNIQGEFTSEGGTLLFVDVARQERFRMSAIGKLGFQRLIGQHLYLDAYTGLGVFYRDVAYTDRVGEREASEDFIREWGFFGPVPEGQRWLPELALGVRIGWWW